MKIKKLEMTDFRQFNGKQTLNFATDDQQNVTIIMGQNGAGKTGIYRAILFALFGDTELSQDAENADVHLINEVALHEGKGRVAQAQVGLTFEHSGVTYQIQRTVHGRFDGHTYYQEAIKKQECELTIIVKGQNPQVITDRVIANKKIEAIIRRDIREFFFFDAESLQILADLGKDNVRDQVRKGIYQLLQVQDLETGRKILKTLHSRIQREVRNQAKDSQTQTKQNELIKVEKKMADYKNQVQDLKGNIQQAKSELEEKQSRYKDSEITRELLDKIQNMKQSTNQLQQKLGLRLDNLSGFINQGATQLFSDLLPDIRQQVNSLRSSHQDNIPKFVIEQSLKDHVCMLCGHDLNSDSEAQAHVKELLRLFKYSQSATYLTSIEQGIAEVTQKHNDFVEKQNVALTEYFKDCTDYSHQRGDLDGLQNELQVSANEIAEMKGLADAIKHINADLNEQSTILKERQQTLPELQKRKEQLSLALVQSQAEDSDIQYRYRENELFQEMEDSLSQILENYSAGSRKQLEIRTLNLFKQFVAVKDQDLIGTVTIKQNYQIQVINAQGRDLSNDLSQGEKQILSLAFVMALAQVASRGRDEMAFPLFMDTPFARIDGDNRDRLIAAIPRITGQWILLLTDTEFTSAERDEFIEQGSVGATYCLNNSENKTTIEPVVDLALLELRGENNG